MSKSSSSPIEFDAARYKRIVSDLQTARQTILDLIEPNLNAILESYSSCETRVHARAWEAMVADTLIQSAKILTPEEGSYLRDRAYCPLCGKGSDAVYEVGYAVPEGLRRHLVGWGKVNQCGVMVAAMGLAKNSWNSRFCKQEEFEEAMQRKTLAARMQTETLYLTAPNTEPKLLDTERFFCRPRTAEKLTWAELRLKDLGFRIRLQANVKAYIDDLDSLVIYADPTNDGKIELRAYKKTSSKRIIFPLLNSLEIPDRWKHDLKEKYEHWIQDTLNMRR